MRFSGNMPPKESFTNKKVHKPNKSFFAKHWPKMPTWTSSDRMIETTYVVRTATAYVTQTIEVPSESKWYCYMAEITGFVLVVVPIYYVVVFPVLKARKLIKSLRKTP